MTVKFKFTSTTTLEKGNEINVQHCDKFIIYNAQN